MEQDPPLGRFPPDHAPLPGIGLLRRRWRRHIKRTATARGTGGKARHLATAAVLRLILLLLAASASLLFRVLLAAHFSALRVVIAGKFEVPEHAVVRMFFHGLRRAVEQRRIG